nr:MAG TPA: hypothetical protein [Caudoviricetes sp.]
MTVNCSVLKNFPYIIINNTEESLTNCKRPY